MKKWWWFTASCVCNSVAATSIIILFFVDIAKDSSGFSGGDVLGLIVLFLGYGIYILSDLWGLKLYSHYKNLISVSFTNAGKLHVLLFFLSLVQVFMGYAAFSIIRLYFLYPNFEMTDTFQVITRFMILIIFFTSLIVFTGFILLLRSIKRNNLIFKHEIDDIGKSQTEKT